MACRENSEQIRGERFRSVGISIRDGFRGRQVRYAEEDRPHGQPIVAQFGADSDGQRTIASEQALKLALSSHTEKARLVIDRAQDRVDRFAIRPALQSDRALPDRRKDARPERFDRKTATGNRQGAVGEIVAKTNEAGVGEDNSRDVRALREFNKPGGNVTSPVINLKIGPEPLDLAGSTHARSAKVRAARQRVKAGRIPGDEDVVRGSAFEHGGHLQLRKLMTRKIFQAMHRGIDRPRKQGLFEFPREESLSAGVTRAQQRKIQLAIAPRHEDTPDDFHFGKISSKRLLGQLGLREREGRSARAENNAVHRLSPTLRLSGLQSCRVTLTSEPLGEIGDMPLDHLLAKSNFLPANRHRMIGNRLQ